MIEARGLTRHYGAFVAVDRVDLAIGAGEVTGFLGVNGAGKTTTLRMLAGSLAPTAGSAHIAGHDLATAPRAAKRVLGYLPERPPLYEDMRVRAYVRLAARLHEVDDDRAAADHAMARTGVSDVADVPIAQLSKGYRQRVGLAAALAHRPAVLLLDEPASGLDPVQRVAMRTMLRDLADGEVTVLLSTHVLADVASLCDRVLVMHKGSLVADEAVADAEVTEWDLEVARPEGLDHVLRDLPAITRVEAVAPGRLRVHATADVRAEVARLAVDHDLRALTPTSGLERRFLALVQEAP